MVKSLQQISSNRSSNTAKRRNRNSNNCDDDGEERGRLKRSPFKLLIRWIFVFSSLWMIWIFVFSRRIIFSSIGLKDDDEISQYPIELLFANHNRPTSTKNNPLLLLPPPPPNIVDDHILTIAIDRKHSCPDLCTWAHIVLPTWVKFRYIDFENEIDIATTIEEDDGMFSKQRRRQIHHHVLVVARTNIINLANWAAARRRSSSNGNTTTTVSIGLWHYADERAYPGEIQNVYHKFDYVIRHYWGQEYWDERENSDGTLYGYILHALGNYTCGTKPQPLPLNDNGQHGPKWGVHWAFLNSHGMNIQLERSTKSIWPISIRPNNCSFIGRWDVKRSKGERSAMDVAMKTLAHDLKCQITFTNGFSNGNTNYRYLNYDLGQTKIGLSPRGSAMETHRLTELLRMGTIPAVVDAPYLHAPFRDVPAILGSNWSHVAFKMNDLISNNNNQKKLEELSQQGAQFYAELEACMMADMDFILRGAFGI